MIESPLKHRLFEALFKRAFRAGWTGPAGRFFSLRRQLYLPRWGHIVKLPEVKGDVAAQRKLLSAVLVIIRELIDDEETEFRKESFSEVMAEFSNTFRLSDKELETYGSQLKRRDIDFDKALVVFIRASKGDRRSSQILFGTMCYLACYDDRPSERHHKLLRSAASDLDLSPAEYTTIWKFYDEQREALRALQRSVEGDDSNEALRERVRDVKDPFYHSLRVLGCDRTSGMQFIRERYRELIFHNHPDRLVAQGAAPKEIEEGRKKMLEITQAYDFLRRSQDEMRPAE